MSVDDQERDVRPAPRVLRVCRAESCQGKGCEALLEHVESRLRVRLGGTTADGRFTLYDIYCLGNCSNSPSVMLDGKIFGRMSPQSIDALLGAIDSPTY